MKKLDVKKLTIALAVLTALPLAALAAPPADAPSGGKAGFGPPAGAEERLALAQKRMRVARAVGLAEALDLDAAGATRLAETLDRFDQKRRSAQKQQHEAMQVLHQAARGDKEAESKVDDAVKKVFEARSQLATVDRETFDAVAKGLSPEKRARAAVFLGHFQQRFGRGMGMMGGRGMGGRGMGGPGMGGPGMGGPGMGGMGPGMDRGMMGGGMGGGGPRTGPGGFPDDCPCQN